MSGTLTRHKHSVFSNSKNVEEDFSNNAVWSIREIGGEMWFGTSKGLTILNRSTGNFTSVFHSDTDTSTLPSNNILSILKTKKGEIWIGTTKGLCLLTNRKGGKFSFKNYPLNTIDLLNVQSVIENKNGNLWVGTKNKGLLKFDQKQKTFVPFVDAAKYSEINPDIRSLVLDNQGSLWIGAYDGIYILGQDKSLQKINNSNNSNGIDKVKSIYT